MDKKIASEIAVGIILILAIIIIGIFYWQNNKIQKLEEAQNVLSEQLVTSNEKLTQPTTKQPEQVQPETAAHSSVASQSTSTQSSTQNVAAQPSSSKVGIIFTIKDQKGKLLKGITCAVKADEGTSRMIPEVSQKTGTNGQCSFQNLDPAFPYLVRVYWTSDQSRVSDVSLSWIPAGTTITREIIKPANM